MGIPEVPDQVKRAPTLALRALFAGVGRLLLAAENSAARTASPDRSDTSDQADGAKPGQSATWTRRSEKAEPGPAASRWRSLDQTGNVRLLSARDLEEEYDTVLRTRGAAARQAAPADGEDSTAAQGSTTVSAVPADDIPASAVPADDIPAADIPASAVPAADIPASAVPAADCPADAVAPADAIPSADATPASAVAAAAVHSAAEAVAATGAAPADAAGRAQPAEAPAAKATAPQASDADRLPLPGFDGLSLASIRARLRTLDTAQLQVLADYERKNAGRPDVLGMLERRIEKLETAG